MQVSLTLILKHQQIFCHRSGPGKVLIKSVNIKTASCDNCVGTSEGVRLNLTGEVVGEFLDGVPCTTNVLNKKELNTFRDGLVSSFDGQLDEDTEDEYEMKQMGACFKVNQFEHNQTLILFLLGSTECPNHGRKIRMGW